MSSRNETTQANQTEFLEEAQFLENKSGSFFNLKELKTNKNLRPFYILVILFFLLASVFLLAIVFKKKPAAETTEVEVKENVKLAPLNQRAYDLKEDLKDHDPTKQSYPFPQVDLEFNIN